TRFHRSISHCCPYRRGRRYHCLPSGRGTTFSANVTTRPISFPNLCRSKPADVLPLRCARGNPFFPASESYPGSTLLSHGGRRRFVALHLDHFVSFALVGRAHRKLRT